MQPLRQLHFLRLLADHNQQDNSEHDARKDQHLLIRQFLMSYESQSGNDAGKEETEQHSVENGLTAEL